MREKAEEARKARRANVEHQVSWYRKLLEHVVKSETVISTAEHHIITTVKHYLEMGEPFTKDIFYRLVVSLKHKEMKNADVGKLLIRLAGFIDIEPEDFHTFLIKRSIYVPPDLIELIAERVDSRVGRSRRQSKFTFVPFAAARWKRKSLRQRTSVADVTIINTSEGHDDIKLQTPPPRRMSTRFQSAEFDRSSTDFTYKVRRSRTTSGDTSDRESVKRVSFACKKT